MIQAINDIDRLLQAAPSRYGEAYARDLQLSASARSFDVALDATVAPSAIVFIATRVGFTGGTVEFTTSNGTPLAVDGDVATLTPAALMGSGCEVVATVTYQGDTHVGRQSVTKLLAFDSSVPPAPTGLAAQGALASINLSWDPTNDTNIGAVEIWRALTNDLSAAAPVGETAGLARTYPDVIGAGGRFYYWIRYISKANVLGPFNAQAGTLGTTGTGAEHLLDLLKDQISESQLLASLRDRINLAVAGSEVAGDVAAALQAETDARIAAIDKEIADRLAALRDEAAAREAYVQDYTYNKVETDQALAIQAQAIAAAFTSYTDQVAQQVVTVAAADVRSYGYSRADAEAAEAAQSNAITTSYKSYADGRKDEAVSTAAADVRNYAYSKTDTNVALSSLATTLRGEMASNGGVSEAYVQNYAYSKAEVTASIAGQSTVLTTAYKQYADDRKAEAISTAAADVRSYAYSKSDTNGAIASSASDLRAEFSNNNGATAAWVQEYAYSKAQTNTAIADQTSTLRTTVGDHTTSLQTHGNSIDGLSAQYTVKIDNNGYVTGYGLASSYVNGVPTSAFIINAARFAVVAPGLAPKVMFVVGQIAGQTGVGVSGDLVVDDTISARHLKAESVSARHLSVMGSSDNIIRDPQFRDLAFWGRQGCAVGEWWRHADNTPWKGGASLYLGQGPGYMRETDTPYFNVEPGATYRLEYQVSVPFGFNGQASVFWLLPASAWWPMSSAVNRRGQWGDGLTVEFNSNDAGQLLTFSTLLTVPNDSRNSRALIRIRDQYSSGQLEIGAMSITRVVDATLIGPGSVQTKHLSISQGGDISSGQWGFDQGVGFWLEGAGNGHGARFSLGNSSGAKIICDPQNGIFKLINPEIQGQTVAPFTASISGSLYGAVGNGRQGYGSLTVNAAGNFQGPLSYLWSVTFETANGTTADVGVAGSATGSTASFVGNATNERVYLWASVQIIDAAGRVATAERFQQLNHGNFVAQ